MFFRDALKNKLRQKPNLSELLEAFERFKGEVKRRDVGVFSALESELKRYEKRFKACFEKPKFAFFCYRLRHLPQTFLRETQRSFERFGKKFRK